MNGAKEHSANGQLQCGRAWMALRKSNFVVRSAEQLALESRPAGRGTDAENSCTCYVKRNLCAQEKAGRWK